MLACVPTLGMDHYQFGGCAHIVDDADALLSRIAIGPCLVCSVFSSLPFFCTQLCVWKTASAGVCTVLAMKRTSGGGALITAVRSAA
eukprot:2376967-Prymnesium_polylepis.1